MRNFKSIFVGLITISFIVIANVQFVFAEPSPSPAVDCGERASCDGPCTATDGINSGSCRIGNQGKCECMRNCGKEPAPCGHWNPPCCPGYFCTNGANPVCLESPPPPPEPCPGQKICGNDTQGFIVCCLNCESEGCKNRLQRPTPTPLCPDQEVCGYVQGSVVCCFDCDSEGCKNQLQGSTPTPTDTPVEEP